MRNALVISLGGALLLGCGGGGGGLSAGNAAPRLVGLTISPDPPKIPLGAGLQLLPDIADEEPGSCQVTWTLRVWDGTFDILGNISMIDAQTGTHISDASPTKTTTGEAQFAQYDVILSGWYTVVVTVKDSDGASHTSTYDFAAWCQSHGFGDCALLPVGDASDATDPTIDVTRVVLKGTVDDTAGGAGGRGVQSLTVAPAGTVNLASPGAASSAFDSTIDCPGQAVVGTPVVTTVTFTATDVESNAADKQVTVTEQIP